MLVALRQQVEEDGYAIAPDAVPEELLQRHMGDITRLLTALTSTAREFAETSRPAKAQP